MYIIVSHKTKIKDLRISVRLSLCTKFKFVILNKNALFICKMKSIQEFVTW